MNEREKKIRYRVAGGIAFLALALSPPLFAAPAAVTLEWCQKAAREHSPNLEKIALSGRGERLSADAANTAWLPRLTVSGKYTQQSDVTSLGISLPVPGVSLPEPERDQWQIAAELSQTLWDGGATAARKAAIRSGAAVEKARAETALHALRDRVNGLYFSVLLVDGQLDQNRILREELAENERRVSALVANGVAAAGDLDAVRVESLNAEQGRISLVAARKTLLAGLSALTGESFTGEEAFKIPEAEPSTAATAMEGTARPEAALYAALRSANDSQKAQQVSQALPKVAAFAQGGYGKPGINMFDTDPAAFWIVGVRLSWSVDGFWSLPFTLARVDVDGAAIDADRDSFFQSLRAEVAGDRTEIERLAALVASDEGLVLLRGRMKDAAKTKFDNGTIGTVDYLREINAEALARQSRALHEIQLIQARFALSNALNQ